MLRRSDGSQYRHQPTAVILPSLRISFALTLVNALFWSNQWSTQMMSHQDERLGCQQNVTLWQFQWAGAWTTPVPVLRRVLAPHLWPGQSARKRVFGPIRTLPFAIIWAPPLMGYHYTANFAGLREGPRKVCEKWLMVAGAGFAQDPTIRKWVWDSGNVIQLPLPGA